MVTFGGGLTDDWRGNWGRYLVVKRQGISEGFINRKWGMCGRGRWIWTGEERDDGRDVRVMWDGAC